MPCYVDDVEDLGAMVIAQIITVAVAALAIVWNQQRTVAALRTEMREENAALRAEIAALRSEMREEIGALRTEVAANSERLSRIEGYLGIGMSAEAAAGAAGAFITAGARTAQPQTAD